MPLLSADLIVLYQQAGVALTPAVDTFTSSQAKLPDGDGPFTFIVETPGLAPNYSHSQQTPWREWLSVQVSVRARNFDDAMTLARQLCTVVKTVVNRTINGTFYLSIRPRQSEPFDMGQDGAGLAKVGFNVLAQARG